MLSNTNTLTKETTPLSCKMNLQKKNNLTMARFCVMCEGGIITGYIVHNNFKKIYDIYL